MTSATPWVGIRRVAFVPVYRPNAAPPDQLPADWPSAILQRVLYNPRTEARGTDRSLRAWLRAASSGRADIDPAVVRMQTVDRQVVEADDLEGVLGDQLRSQGFDGAVLVMLGGRGAGTNRGFWSRVVMAESNGVWLMEMMHGLTRVADFYHYDSDTDPADRSIDSFEQMSASGQTHPTAYVKNELGWLDGATILRHDGASTEYDLQHVSLAQPPAAGRAAAVRIGDGSPFVLVESRLMTDQFEVGMPSLPAELKEYGIASEGVIAYRVQTTDPTREEHPGGKLPLYLMTQRALQVGQSAPLDDGVTLTVLGALPDGLRVRVDDANRHVLDRTAATGAHLATGSPTAIVVPAAGISDIAYRDIGSNLDEIWRAPNGSGTTDLTANAAATGAASDPWFWFDPPGNMVVLGFRGSDNHVRSLYWMFGAVGQDDLSGSIGAQNATGIPAGWFSTHDGFHHVAYRGDNGHLHELYWQGQGGVGHGDLTAAAGAVPSAGSPWPYYDPTRSTHIVAFRGTDGRIRSLYWGPDGAVGQDDLSGTAGTPPAAVDPVAWYTAVEDTNRVVCLAATGHIYELAWQGVAPVVGRDLTALSGAPVAEGRVSGGYNAADNTQHVIFRSSDGRLHELWHFLGEAAVHHEDLTAAYGAPAATGSPVYYSTPWSPNQHVAYRGTDGHIYDVLW